MCYVCDSKGLSRRHLFSAGVGALALTAAAAGARARPTRSVETPDAAYTRLMEGNARYVSGQMKERDFSAGRVARTQGQAPFAAILGCADSRVAPELAFDQTPGELFVVRVAGNFVTPDGLGSLEYGAAVLGTKVIMVLGHNSCGAIGATIGALQKGNTLPGHIAGLVTAMKPGVEAVVKAGGRGSRAALRRGQRAGQRAPAADREADPGRHGRRRQAQGGRRLLRPGHRQGHSGLGAWLHCQQ